MTRAALATSAFIGEPTLGHSSHITHADARQGVQEMYGHAEVTAADIAEVIAFALSRPRHLAFNEVLLRPAGQL